MTCLQEPQKKHMEDGNHNVFSSGLKTLFAHIELQFFNLQAVLQEIAFLPIKKHKFHKFKYVKYVLF